MAPFVYFTAEYGRSRFFHKVHFSLQAGEAKVKFATWHVLGDHAAGWHVTDWHGRWEAVGKRWVKARAHWNGVEEKAKVLWFRTDELVLHAWHSPCIEDIPQWDLMEDIQ